MNFNLTDDQLALQDLAKKFSETELAPMAEAENNDEAQSESLKNLVQKMGQAGLTGITVPEKFGGSAMGSTEFALVIEQMAKYSTSQVVTLAVTNLPTTIILTFGNEAQQKKYIPNIVAGNCIGSFCLSESGSGSDAASLTTTAKLEGDHYILNGAKLWISNAPEAGIFIVMARTGNTGKSSDISAFIVEGGTPGLKLGKNEDKMGLKGSHTTEVLFENCKIPKENLIGEEGMGFKIALTALDCGRINIAAAACGLASAALDYATQFAKVREQFNQPIFNFQGLQWMLADHYTELEASRLLVYFASTLKDQGRAFTKQAAMAKLKSTEMAMSATTDCVQILGGAGYTTEYPVERYMRDAKVLQIVEGTNQIQKIVIARHL